MPQYLLQVSISLNFSPILHYYLIFSDNDINNGERHLAFELNVSSKTLGCAKVWNN
jgi:hypothetical protein